MNKLPPGAVISTPQLVTQQGDIQFAVIADPTPRLHAEFGVGWSPRAVLDPHAWLAGFRAVARRRPSRRASSQQALELSTDLLVAADDHILACKSGVHADDRWSLDNVLHLASRYLPATDHPVPA
jgi:hypothetical protein